MLASLALAVAVACAQAVVQVCTVVVRMVVVVSGVVQVLEAGEGDKVKQKQKQLIMVQAPPAAPVAVPDAAAPTPDDDPADAALVDEKVPALSVELWDDPEDVWLDAETGTQVESETDTETEMETGAEKAASKGITSNQYKISMSGSTPQSRAETSYGFVDGYIVSDSFQRISIVTLPVVFIDIDIVPSPSLTRPGYHHDPYTGVGDKVADFVKRYKDMQAELIETKQRLAIAEDYKQKYEELKAEMDEILGNQ